MQMMLLERYQLGARSVILPRRRRRRRGSSSPRSLIRNHGLIASH